MTMLAGAAAVDITPPLPVDVLGFVRRAVAPRLAWEPLLATACVLRTPGTTVVIVAADLAGLTTPIADRIRERIAEAIGCDPANVLLNSSHSHSAPWPGATIKLGGEFDGWTERERRYWESLPDLYASAAVQAAERLVPARVGGGVGRVAGLAVNRRERTADGRTILGWNPDGFIDESVVAIRIDEAGGGPARGGAASPGGIATFVGFGCHPVVLGPELPHVSPDFVGPLRRHLSSTGRPGAVTVFLQGAAGNVLPLEGFFDHHGPEVVFGERLALEAAHAIADLDPRPTTIEGIEYGSVTPISLYRRRPVEDPPAQPLRVARRIVALPLLELPAVGALETELAERHADLAARRARGETRATTNPVKYHVDWLEAMLAAERAGGRPTEVPGEIWAARLGDCAIVGAPGEIFGEIGAAVRAGSPAAVTIFAGYCQGVLGYVPTPEEYPYGGYEPAVSHRGYGLPAPFSPDVAGIIRETSLSLLRELFADEG